MKTVAICMNETENATQISSISPQEQLILFNLLEHNFNYNFNESAKVQLNDTERFYVFLKLIERGTILS